MFFYKISICRCYFNLPFFLTLFLLCVMVVVCPRYGMTKSCQGYSVVLTDAGADKIKVIKTVRGQTGMSLRETKEMIDSAPVAVMVNLPREVAENNLHRLEDIGATVRLECSAGNIFKPSRPVLLPRDSHPPQVSIETATILVKTVGDRIQVRGRAEDNNKVASIIIFAEEQPVKTCAAWECWYSEVVTQAGPRNYHAEALDQAGNRGVSNRLEFMVHSTAKAGPSLNVHTAPYHPASSEKVRFTASGSHPSGVREITFYIEGKQVHSCYGSTCEYLGGPFAAGTIHWRVSARSGDGGETYGAEHLLEIKSAPITGNCSISGRAIGPRADAAPVFFVTLFGPGDERLYREKARFMANGQYGFERLPIGRYRLTVDSPGDIAVGAHPVARIVECRGAGPDNIDFEFR